MACSSVFNDTLECFTLDCLQHQLTLASQSLHCFIGAHTGPTHNVQGVSHIALLYSCRVNMGAF